MAMKPSLKLALVKDGRRQYEIARQARMTETRLSRLACGRAEPTEQEKLRLAEALGLDVPELFPSRGGAR